MVFLLLEKYYFPIFFRGRICLPLIYLILEEQDSDAYIKFHILQ